MLDGVYMGEIRYFAFDFVPSGFVPCDGQLVRIAEFNALYALLGTRFGGDGLETFALPKLPHKDGDPDHALMLLPCIAVDGMFPPRSGY